MKILELRMNTEIYGRNGKLGKQSGVVVSPTTWQVTSLIMKQNSTVTQEKNIPLTLVNDASSQKLTLRSTKEEIKTYPDYEKKIIKEESPANFTDTNATPMVRKTVQEGILPDALVLNHHTSITNPGGQIGQFDGITVGDEDHKINYLIVKQNEHFSQEILIPVEMIAQLSENEILVTT